MTFIDKNALTLGSALLLAFSFAAGAGGKSLALAATMQNQGEIVACDIRQPALQQLAARAIITMRPQSKFLQLRVCTKFVPRRPVLQMAS